MMIPALNLPAAADQSALAGSDAAAPGTTTPSAEHPFAKLLSSHQVPHGAARSKAVDKSAIASAVLNGQGKVPSVAVPTAHVNPTRAAARNVPDPALGNLRGDPLLQAPVDVTVEPVATDVSSPAAKSEETKDAAVPASNDATLLIDPALTQWAASLTRPAPPAPTEPASVALMPEVANKIPTVASSEGVVGNPAIEGKGQTPPGLADRVGPLPLQTPGRGTPDAPAAPSAPADRANLTERAAPAQRATRGERAGPAEKATFAEQVASAERAQLAAPAAPAAPAALAERPAAAEPAALTERAPNAERVATAGQDALAAVNAKPSNDVERPLERSHPADLSAPAPAMAPSGVGAPVASFAVPGSSHAANSLAPVTLDLPVPVAAPEFRGALGVQVSVLARDGVQHAQLNLTPPEMGPISVQIALEGTQARVDFGADTASTRQIIESGMPELAAALRDAGLTLSGGSVSQHSRGRSQGGNGEHGPSGSTPSDGRSTEHDAVTVRRTGWRVPQGAVDLYA